MLEALLAALGGLLIGSFLNVCIYRMPRDLSVVRPRSYCPACEHPIAWYDNIPLASFAALRGRCRHCGARIPWRYPVVELLTGLFFLLAVWQSGVSLPAGKLCLFSALILGLMFADLEQRILPDEFTLGGAAAGLALAAARPPVGGWSTLILPPAAHPAFAGLIESAAAAVFTGGVMWLVGLVYERIRKREGLGFGDVKMVAMIATFLYLQPTLLALILGSTLGSLGGLAYILVTRKDASTYELPFGTFLGAGALIVAWLGPRFLGPLAG